MKRSRTGSRTSPLRSRWLLSLARGLVAASAMSPAASLWLAWSESTLQAQPPALGSTQPPQPASNQVVYWPRRDFVIPFQIDPTGETPVEVQLEFSENRGQDWALYTRGDVRTRQFNFHSVRDGEYRFRLKTVDSKGNVYDNPGEPLLVLVDTQKPSGELVVDVDPRGSMQAEFRLVDATLDTDSLRFEYQTDAQSIWTEIPYELTAGTRDGEWTGFGTWTMPDSASQLIVRVVARDLAGNSAELTRMPRLPRSASTGGSMVLASNVGHEEPGPPIGSGIAKRPPAQSVLITEDANIPKVEIIGGPGARNQPSPADRELLARQQMLENQERIIEQQNRLLMQQRAISDWSRNDPLPPLVTAPPLQQLPTRPMVEVNNTGGPAPLLFPEKPVMTTADTPNTRDTGAPGPMVLGDAPRGLPVSNRTPMTSIASSDSPPSAAALPSQATPQLNASVPPNPSAIGQSGPSRTPLYSMSKAFRLDYSVDNRPIDGIANIELWGTTDQGLHWEKWGIDGDRQSPFEIEVETEGLFGFRMVIVGVNGLASRRPLPGGDADAWIEVDTSLPQTNLVSVLNGRGPDAGSLVIEYTATDAHFPERPISLFYSESPSGPWQPITQGARNHGRFVWPADPSLPPTVFIRLEAVDAAGNVGVHQLDLPVDVQGAAPRGRIQGFRPLK